MSPTVGKLRGAQDVIAQTAEGVRIPARGDRRAGGRSQRPDIAAITGRAARQLEGLPGRSSTRAASIPGRGDAVFACRCRRLRAPPLANAAGDVLPLDSLATLENAGLGASPRRLHEGNFALAC